MCAYSLQASSRGASGSTHDDPDITKVVPLGRTCARHYIPEDTCAFALLLDPPEVVRRIDEGRRESIAHGSATMVVREYTSGLSAPHPEGFRAAILNRYG